MIRSFYIIYFVLLRFGLGLDPGAVQREGEGAEPGGGQGGGADQAAGGSPSGAAVRLPTPALPGARPAQAGAIGGYLRGPFVCP